MEKQQETLEYASENKPRGLAGGPWLFGIAVLSVAAGYLPFVRVIIMDMSALDAFEQLCEFVSHGAWRQLWYEPYVMSIILLLAPAMAYFIGRTVWGSLTRPERWTGYVMAAAGTGILVAYSWKTGSEMVHTLITQGFDDPHFFFMAALSLTVTAAALAAGAVIWHQLRRTHKPGVGLCVFLMACYVANASWALVFAAYTWWREGLKDVRSGAVVCGAAATWYAVEIVLMGWNGAAARREFKREQANRTRSASKGS